MKRRFLAIFGFCVGLGYAQDLTGVHLVDEGAAFHEMVVKYKASTLPVEVNGVVEFDAPLTPLPPSSELSRSQLHTRPVTALFPLSGSHRQMRQFGPVPAPQGKVNTVPLAGMMKVDLSGLSLSEMVELCQEYELLPEVEYCSLSPVNAPGIASEFITPPTPSSSQASETPPASPDFSAQQGYFDSGNNGIDAEWAWSIGLNGSNLTVRDAEWAIDTLHEDYVGHVHTGLAQTGDSYEDHGTAVMGVLVAQHNGFGIQGAVPDADGWFYSENTGRTTAISAMVNDASLGDILVLEMQMNGCDSKLSTPDYSSAVWDLVKAATDAGVVVVMAAGNGNSDLDGACYSSYHARGDNGGIIVGAGTSSTGGKMSFSTHGARVNLRGWGTSVTTAGYGNLYGSGHTEYTSSFNGTSSATPVVTSAVALVQSWAKIKLGSYLTSQELRSLLIATGHAQRADTSTPIGPLPNVRAAIEKLASDNGVSVELSGGTSSSQATSSSSAISSSSAVSSSSDLSSSSVVISSSSQSNIVDCSSYPDWQARNYDYTGTKEYVVYNDQLYSHTEWVNSTTPDNNSGWTYEGDCESQVSSSVQVSSSALSSSSEVISSSSEVVISSSEALSSSSDGTVGLEAQFAVELSAHFDALGGQIEISEGTRYQVRLMNTLGETLDIQTAQGHSQIQWNTSLQVGQYYVIIQGLQSRGFQQVYRLRVSQ